MRAFPAEFEALLSPKGRQLLRGRGPAYAALQRAPFFTAAGVKEQLLVSARDGHPGHGHRVRAARLAFHDAAAGLRASDRRWLVLGSFLLRS